MVLTFGWSTIGKSLFTEWLEFKHIAESVPPYRLMDDIFSWVCSRPIRPCYVMDLPRGMKKYTLGRSYYGIEIIQNGCAYDKRYTTNNIWCIRPTVIIFTHMFPCFD